MDGFSFQRPKQTIWQGWDGLLSMLPQGLKISTSSKLKKHVTASQLFCSPWLSFFELSLLLFCVFVLSAASLGWLPSVPLSCALHHCWASNNKHCVEETMLLGVHWHFLVEVAEVFAFHELVCFGPQLPWSRQINWSSSGTEVTEQVAS